MAEAFITMENVGFGWPRGQLLFREVNLTIAQDSALALMGANGSGKTTMAS